MASLATVAQFSTKVGKAIEGFLYEKSKRSEATATSYKGDIKRFLSDVYDKSINTITAEELEVLDYDSFKNFLNSFEGKSNSVVNRYASSIKSMYKHLNSIKAINVEMNFFDLKETLPNKAESYEVIPMETCKQYIEATQREKHKATEKKYAIKLALELALRESEVRELEWKQFKPDGNEVIVTGVGKGNVKFIDKISRDFYNELLELKVEGQSKLFTLTKKNLTDMMVRLRKELRQEDRNYTFHSFKKTSVTNTYRYTGSITAAQKKGKHKLLATTQLYLGEEDTVMTGYFSLEGNLNHNLYKEVSHETLLGTLKEMSKEMLFLLNLKLQDNK